MKVPTYVHSLMMYHNLVIRSQACMTYLIKKNPQLSNILLQLRSQGFWTVCKIKKIQMLWKMCCRASLNLIFDESFEIQLHKKLHCFCFGLKMHWLYEKWKNSLRIPRLFLSYCFMENLVYSTCFSIYHWCDDPFIMNFLNCIWQKLAAL